MAVPNVSERPSTWRPAPPAPWVAEANRGERPEFRPEPGPFDPDALMAASVERHPESEFDPDIVEPLGILCSSLDGDAALTPLGRWATQRYLARLLDGHRALEAAAHADPGLDRAAIDRPVFVIGAPRTGTTTVHRLLATHPEVRVPEGWEFAMPVPAPSPADHDTDPRIASMAPELVFPQSVASGLRAIHTYSSRMPKECLSAQAFSFRTEEFISRYHVPEYVRWLSKCDMGPAYRTHRRVLSVLQSRMPRRRWVLKSPVHLQAVPTLVETYPDAAFVVTHRDPARILASVSSLVATMRSAFSDAVDPVEIGRHHLELYSKRLDALVDHVDSGVLRDAAVSHLRHHDLLVDPVAAVERVGHEVGLALSSAWTAALAAEAASERDDAAGGHRYRSEDFGLDDNRCRAAFARYRARFLEGDT